MRRSLSEIALGTHYSTGRNDLIREFYLPCLNAADRYDRAVGYFRSTLYILVGLAFSDFALRLAKMRVVCSPQLSPEDVEALRKGYEARDVVSDSLTRDLQATLNNPETRPVTEFMATLVACSALDIRLAYRPTAAGIFHDKLGIFRDDLQNTVTFVGSANETYSAWDFDANHEGFEVFRSWEGPSDAQRIAVHRDSFEDLWEGRAIDVVTKSFSDAVREQLLTAALPAGIDDAAGRVRHVVEARRRNLVRLSESPNLHRRFAKVGDRILQRHQLAAIENWRGAGYRGIIDQATGAGKTVTALRAIRDWAQADRPTLILVPSEILANQWRREVAVEMPDVPILMAGAGYGRETWTGEVADFTRDLAELGPRVTIATLATASSGAFRHSLRAGEHLLLVADEVHRTGSTSYRAVFNIEAGGRLGLSATPQRYGDPDGTAAIFAYFGKVLEPTFGIREAIAAGRLVQYDYFVHDVSLSEDEQKRWDELTSAIQRAYVRLPKGSEGSRVQSERFRQLLYARASVLKQARGKVNLALSVISGRYHPGDRWLVYCDGAEQLKDVREALATAGLPVYEYHSAMQGERSATLDHFVTHGGILVAIRCLDEGVDIPSVNRALILASSTNSREYVQRRGRVLRTAPDKYSAEIHDLLVVPAKRDSDQNRSTILRSELARAAQFASYARNTAVSVELDLLARTHGLTDFDSETSNLEDD